jgi:hypothetical protein
MRNGWYEVKDADGTTRCVDQPFYFPNDHPSFPSHFKGMEQIIRERGLWPASNKLNAECKGFKCPEDRTDCCCRRLLFNQPDFVQQKSALSELIERRGHICDYYPKYHCELNFIEQYWGAAKFRYRNTPPTHTMDEVRANVKTCLDAIPLALMRKYVDFPMYFLVLIRACRHADRAIRFMHAYRTGLSGGQAAWVNRQYHGHRTIPPEWIAKVRSEYIESL